MFFDNEKITTELPFAGSLWANYCMALVTAVTYSVLLLSLLFVMHMDETKMDDYSLSASTYTGYESYVFANIASIVGVLHGWSILTWFRLLISKSVLIWMYGVVIGALLAGLYQGLACVPMSKTSVESDQSSTMSIVHSQFFGAIVSCHFVHYVSICVMYVWGCATNPPVVRITKADALACMCLAIINLCVGITFYLRGYYRDSTRLVLMWLEGSAIIFVLWANILLTRAKIAHTALHPTTRN